MSRISIVMAYFNHRLEQTYRTLLQMQRVYDDQNFEVILIDDASDPEYDIRPFLQTFDFVRYYRITQEMKGDRINPGEAYNIGFRMAMGDIIIIQNPECYHVGNILEYVRQHLGFHDYITFSCFRTTSESMSVETLKNPENIENYTFVRTLWYNHPDLKPTAYHFCSAIHKEQLEIMGGFDISFSSGYCFDDDDFVLRVRHILRLNVVIVPPESVFVIHQYHRPNDGVNVNFLSDEDIKKKKWLRNKDLLESKQKYFQNLPFSFPRIVHLYWDGSNMSFLHLCTVLSFNKHHPHWRIIIHVPVEKNPSFVWKTGEHAMPYTETCFFSHLSRIPNVMIRHFNIDTDILEKAPDIIKSDYWRYYVLYKYGGVWSDFDIMYTANIESNMNFDVDVIAFGDYFPVGLFVARPSSHFFKRLVELCPIFYNPHNYQCLGSHLLRRNFQMLLSSQEKIKICGLKTYLPWGYEDLDQIFDSKDNDLPKETIGIHWFNGSTRAKTYTMLLARIIRDGTFTTECFMDKFVQPYIHQFEKQKEVGDGGDCAA